MVQGTPATSCSPAWLRRSGPWPSHTRRGSPSTARPPSARPPSPTSWRWSCADGAAASSGPRSTILFPRAQRYPRGEYSAEGCYHDTHDHDALNRVLLDPLGPGGDGRFQSAVYDRTEDVALSPPVTTAPADAVLIFDGVFLLRPELIDRWDLRVFVSTALDRTVERAVIRERRVSSRADVERRWRECYILSQPSQQLYFATVHPTRRASVTLHNDEPERPVWETRTP